MAKPSNSAPAPAPAMLTADQFLEHATPLPLGNTGVALQPRKFASGSYGYYLPKQEIPITVAGVPMRGFAQLVITVLESRLSTRS